MIGYFLVLEEEEELEDEEAASVEETQPIFVYS
jgi:hypothetical protein